MIVVDDLWFSYPGSSHSLFQGLSLRVATCSWVVLTGPDGAGKTTLGRLIAGVYQPTRGKIRIEPTDVGSGCAVGYVGSDPYDYLVGTTVEEDVTFGLENLGLSSTEITVRLKQALAWTGLQGMEQRLTHSLSGGEQQKLALASMLAMDARVLILDGALCMVDRSTRHSIHSLLQSLRSNPGITIIEVVQNPEEMLQADRLLFLSQGRIEYDGPPGGFFSTGKGRQWCLAAGGLPALRSALCHKLGNPDAWRLVDQWEEPEQHYSFLTSSNYLES